jgi:hypothetical protein
LALSRWIKALSVSRHQCSLIYRADKGLSFFYQVVIKCKGGTHIVLLLQALMRHPAMPLSLRIIDPARKRYRFRHSREGGNPAGKIFRKADKRWVLSRLARVY